MKSRSGKKNAFRQKLLYVAVAACFSGQPAYANPIGGQVVRGSASISQQGGVMTVVNTPRTIVNWQQFSIGTGETTRFIQQSASSAILNRVVGVDPSSILGNLTSNGRVYLINPNGIVFGAGSRIDTAGFTASTLNLSDQDFINGRMNFTAGATAGKIANQGNISTPSGGSVYLIAPDIENSGIITSPNGEIILAAGKTVELVDATDPSLRVKYTAPEGQAVNMGQIIAEGGKAGIYAGLISQRGTVSASSAVAQGGKIYFKATQAANLEAGSQTTASGTAGGSVTVQTMDGDTIIDSATVGASGMDGKGGDVQLLGNRVGLTGATSVDASGKTGGGNVLVGGDYQGKNTAVHNSSITYFGQDASLNASATDKGDGGKVIVWADDATRAYGTITATGGANGGNGGFVETSGHYLDMHGISVSTASTSDKAGTWLLDPTLITIVGGSGDGATDGTGTVGNIFMGDSGPTIVYQSEIVGQSVTTSILLQATDGIATSGTFTGNQVLLAANSSLNMATRNGPSDGVAGIDLTSSGTNPTLEFKVQGTGNISLQTGSYGQATGALAAPIKVGNLTAGNGQINLYGTGNITVEGSVSSLGWGGAGPTIQLASQLANAPAGVVTTAGIVSAQTGQIDIYGKSILIGSGGISSPSATFIGSTLTVGDTGSVTQTGAIVADYLKIAGSGGSVVLNHAGNNVGTLQATLSPGTAPSSLSYHDSNALTLDAMSVVGGAINIDAVGMLTAMGLITTNGDPSFKNAGAITLSGSSVELHQPISAIGLGDVLAAQPGGLGGNVLVRAAAANGTLSSSNIDTRGGNAYTSSTGVNGGNGGNITLEVANGGTIDGYLGFTANFDSSGGIKTSGGSSSDGVDGTITVRALAGNLTVAEMESFYNDIHVTATGGAIFSGGGGADDIIAPSIYLTAANGIAPSGPDLKVNTNPAFSLHFNNTTTGDVHIVMDNTLTVDDGQNTGGNVFLTSTGIFGTSKIQLDRSKGNVTASGNITYIADQFDVIGTGSFGLTSTSGAGSYVQIQPYYLAATDVEINTTTATFGALWLTPAELQTITSQTLKVGTAASQGNVTLVTGTTLASTDINASKLQLIGDDVIINGAIGPAFAHHVDLQANNNIVIGSSASISNAAGAYSITLNSDRDATGGGAVWLDTGSILNSNGGNIVIGGGATPATGYALGNSSITSGHTLNSGIYVLGNISAGSGNVTMHGEGANINDADGIAFAGGLLSSNGIVTIDGKAHKYSSTTSGTEVAAGVDFLNAGTRLSTQTGTVTVTGLNNAPSQGGSFRAQGITVEAGTIIESTGTGTLTLNGISTSLDTAWGVGVFGGTIQTTAAGGGAITLIGTNVTNPDGGVVINNGHVLSSGGSININGQGNGGAVAFMNTAPNALMLGGSSSGAITIQGLGAGTDFINFTAGAYPSVIDAGSNTLTINNGAGGMSLNSAQLTAGNIVLTSSGNVTLGSSTVLSGTATGNAVQLSAGSFTNTAGSGALSATNGRWLVYSTNNPSLDNRGGLVYDFKQYNATYGVTPVQGAGDGFLYAIAPTITAALSGNAVKTYDGTVNAPGVGAPTVVASGAINGDVITVAGGTGGYDTKNVGTGKVYTVAGSAYTAMDGSALVYGYLMPGASVVGSGNILPTSLSINAVTDSKIYNGTTASAGAANVVGLMTGDTVAGAVQAFGSKNVLGANGSTLSVTGFTVNDGNGGANYIVTSNTTTGTITPATLTVGATGINRAYDGTSNSTVTLGDNRFSGDILTLNYGSAGFVDKNVGVGKSVNISGITLSGTDAGNYTLASTTGSSTANITVRPLSTWIGGNGAWSLASNWDALPDLSNVLAVSIPTGVTATYDLTATTNLQNLTSAGSLAVGSGTLNVGNLLSTVGYTQTSGAVNAGSFVASNSFSQTGGTLAVVGSAAITQTSGNLLLGNFSAGNAALAALSGAIVGTNLQLGGISASASGNINLTNVGSLNIGGMQSSGGNILIDNTGGVVTGTQTVTASNGSVQINAHSPITIGSGGISASGNINLATDQANTSTMLDNITLNGALTSSGGNISLSAADNIAQNANITTSGGLIGLNANTGGIAMAANTTTSSGGGAIGYKAKQNILLSTVNAGSGNVSLTSTNGSLKSQPDGSSITGSSVSLTAKTGIVLKTNAQSLLVNNTGPAGTVSITDGASGTVFTDVPVDSTGGSTTTDPTLSGIDQISPDASGENSSELDLPGADDQEKDKKDEEENGGITTDNDKEEKKSEKKNAC